MEDQKSLEKAEIGTQEPVKLKPAKVKIMIARIEEVGKEGRKKVSCEVEHPDATDPIKISSIKP